MLTHWQRCIHKPQDASRNDAEGLLRTAVRECSCLPGRVETASMTADDYEALRNLLESRICLRNFEFEAGRGKQSEFSSNCNSSEVTQLRLNLRVFWSGGW